MGTFRRQGGAVDVQLSAWLALPLLIIAWVAPLIAVNLFILTMLVLVPVKLEDTLIRSINLVGFVHLHVFSVLVRMASSALNVNSLSTWLLAFKAHVAHVHLDAPIAIHHLQSAINVNLYLIYKVLNVWVLPAKMDSHHIMSPVWTIIFVWNAIKTVIHVRNSPRIAKAVRIRVILWRAKQELIYASCALLRAWHVHLFLYVLAATQVSFTQVKHALAATRAAKAA